MVVHLLPDEHGDSKVHERCCFAFGGTYASRFVSKCRDGVNGGDLMVRDSRCFAGPWSARLRSMLQLRNNGNRNGSRVVVAALIGASATDETHG